MIALNVLKEPGENVLDIMEEVRRVVDRVNAELLAPRGLTLQQMFDETDYIYSSIGLVRQSLLLGGCLAIVVLLLFLRSLTSTLVVAVAIPISMVSTFLMMLWFDRTLNVVSLAGMAFAVGMVVDNSIVVLENIFRHREELGQDATLAATQGAEEVQAAITASTLTTISVFGPIIYVEGVAGELFKDLSLAVAFSLITSLLVALTLLPSLAARFGGGRQERRPLPVEKQERRPGAFGTVRWIVDGIVRAPGRFVMGLWSLARELVLFWGRGIGAFLGRVFGPLLRSFDRGFDRFAVRYHVALEWSLEHPGRVLGVSAVTMVAALSMAALLQRDLLPDVDQGAFQIRLELREGTALETTAAGAARIEEAVLADPDVEAVFSSVGRDVRAYAKGEDASGLHTATFQVRVAEGARTVDVAERVRGLAAGFPPGALSVETGQATALGAMLGSTEADISVRIRSEDLDLAYSVAQEVAARLANVSEVGNVRIGTERGQPQVQVEIDRVACAAYGIDPRSVAETVDRAMRGERATEFVDFDRKIDVVVRYPDELRYSMATLESLRVQGVPIRELVHITEAVGPAEVHREDQARVIPVYADVVHGGLDKAIVAVGGALQDMPPSRDVRWEVGGENEEMRRSFRDLAFAFGLALILVYMILAAQFESFVHPFTILMAVPLALVGAILALVLTGQGLNTMSLIGGVILVGIVVNDAIVKVDFIVQSQERGARLREAILEAGRVRLRPIIMTTVTTVLGLFPMALGIGRGSDLRAPMAIAVIGGLLVATALTLIIVPVVYQTVELTRLRFTGGGAAPAPAPGVAS